MTTDQRTPDAVPSAADRGAWATPGVERAVGPGAVADRAGAEGASADDLAADLAQTGAAGPGAAHPVVIAVLTCLEALESVRTTGLGTLTAKEIRLMLVAVAQVAAAAFGLKLRLLVAGETQRIADLTGATSTGAFLAHLTQMRRPDANAQVRLAKDLDQRFPLLADALARGLVSPDQVTVCVTAMRRLPRDLSDTQQAACQQTLIDAAQHLSPKELKTVGKHLWEVIDPEGAEAKQGEDLENEERRARARASVRFWDNGDGTTGFAGKLPHLQAQMLQKAIQAFASPRRRSNPNIPTGQPDDNRHAHPSPADGSSNAPPGSGGGSGDGCPRREPEREPARTQDPPPSGPTGGEIHGGGEFQDVRGEDDPSPEERETGRTIPYPVRLGHALMDLIERLPRDVLPSYGGAPATIVATMTLEQLRSGVGTATLDTGTEVSVGQLRRLACNAGIIPAVLDGQSQPLDLGRERRLFTPYQRIAMDLRDRGGRAGEDVEGSGCVIEGCDRPASVCDAHHLTAWEDGGNTDLADGVLVCPYHHQRIHDPHWRLTHTHGLYRLRRITS